MKIKFEKFHYQSKTVFLVMCITDLAPIWKQREGKHFNGPWEKLVW